jgi:hypothetical protein
VHPDCVFLLWHVHQLNGDEDEKLIGVYRTKQDAELAISRLQAQPGFRNTPEGFQIVEYAINKDHWTEGFVTL